ncbi:hypothetical protein A8U91_01363 [Halomonas elongata]|uniref:YspA cpYpsA-related SLOG domain-containing protein n=1 Tax=Halomonas elongata TaxID=2746 RepID=A0A1B8P416_HALEL|nr:DUF2493 domain-containing protein [Halomonas elongata]OBX37015.1 hypothetical protein A8U91_01363 [Halomonas elongata]
MSLQGDRVIRCIVAGGRDFDDWPLMKRKLDAIFANQEMVEIVSGGAAGADSLGERYAEERGWPIRRFPADWQNLGRRAGRSATRRWPPMPRTWSRSREGRALLTCCARLKRAADDTTDQEVGRRNRMAGGRGKTSHCLNFGDCHAAFFWRLFPPLEVRLTLEAMKEFMNEASLCRSVVEPKVAALVKDTEKTVYSVRIDRMKPDHLAIDFDYQCLGG